MAPVLRYTVLRVLVFLGVLCAAWLCGLRGFVLLVVAAILSTLVSFFVLNRFRQETVNVVQDKVEARQERATSMREAEDDDDY